MELTRSHWLALWILFGLCLTSAASVHIANKREHFSGSRALAYPTKDVATEQRLPDEWAWLAQTSRCYSCERDMVRRFPDRPEMAYRAKKTKCFSCEST